MPTDTSLEESRKNEKEWLSYYCVTGGVRSDGRISKSHQPFPHMPHIHWGERDPYQQNTVSSLEMGSSDLGLYLSPCCFAHCQ